MEAAGDADDLRDVENLVRFADEEYVDGDAVVGPSANIDDTLVASILKEATDNGAAASAECIEAGEYSSLVSSIVGRMCRDEVFLSVSTQKDFCARLRAVRGVVDDSDSCELRLYFALFVHEIWGRTIDCFKELCESKMSREQMVRKYRGRINGMLRLESLEQLWENIERCSGITFACDYNDTRVRSVVTSIVVEHFNAFVELRRVSHEHLAQSAATRVSPMPATAGDVVGAAVQLHLSLAQKDAAYEKVLYILGWALRRVSDEVGLFDKTDSGSDPSPDILAKRAVVSLMHEDEKLRKLHPPMLTQLDRGGLSYINLRLVNTMLV